MTLQILDSRDVERLSAMLKEWEGGLLYTPANTPADQSKAPIEHYIGLVTADVPASTGDPQSAFVSIYGADNSTTQMATESSFDVTAYSLWSVPILTCSWVHLARDAYSGFLFIVSIPGTSGCADSGSGSGLCCCPVDSLCLRDATSTLGGIRTFTLIQTDTCRWDYFGAIGSCLDGDEVADQFTIICGEEWTLYVVGLSNIQAYTAISATCSPFALTFHNVDLSSCGGTNHDTITVAMEACGAGSGAWYCLDGAASGSGSGSSGSGSGGDSCCQGTTQFCFTLPDGFSCGAYTGTVTMTGGFLGNSSVWCDITGGRNCCLTCAPSGPQLHLNFDVGVVYLTNDYLLNCDGSTTIPLILDDSGCGWPATIDVYPC